MSRNAIQAYLLSTQLVQSSVRVVVVADEEHVIWPFDGEYWRDEQGAYRALLVNGCTH